MPEFQGTCLTIDDVLSYPSCQQIEICCPQEVLQENLEWAIDLIQQVTGLDLCPQYKCLKLKGSGSCELFFNFYESNPLIQPEMVKEEGEEIEVEYNGFKITRVGVFDCCKTYEICGFFGQHIKPGIKKAVVLLTLEASQPGSTGIEASINADRVKWDDFEIDYSKTARKEFGLTTGFVEIDNLIFPYVPDMAQVNFAAIDGHICYKNCCKGDCKCE